MKKSFFHLFRILFALSIVGLGLKTLTEVNKIEPYVSQTIDQVQIKVLKNEFNISHLKQHSHNVVYLEGFLLIACGLLTIFNYRLSKIFILIAVVVDFLLIHNLSFYREHKLKIYSSLLIGLLGGVYNVLEDN